MTDMKPTRYVSTYDVWHERWLTANRDKLRAIELEAELKELTDPLGVPALLGMPPDQIDQRRCEVEQELEALGPQDWVFVPWPDLTPVV